MLYLSKGAILKKSTLKELNVTLYGTNYLLTGLGIRLWLAGRFRINDAKEGKELIYLKKLQELGLAEISEKNYTEASYDLLTRCIICPAKLKRIRYPLTNQEAQIWKWISQAGLRLTIGELVKLFETGTNPSPELLGSHHAQKLTMLLYKDDLSFDTTLEIKMEQSRYRDTVVDSVLGLLRKKHIILT